MLLLVFMVWGECAEGECYRAKVSSHGLALYPYCTAFNCEALDALNSCIQIIFQMVIIMRYIDEDVYENSVEIYTMCFEVELAIMFDNNYYCH